MFLRQFLEETQLLKAGLAPCGPKTNDDDFTFIGGKLVSFALCVQLEFGAGDRFSMSSADRAGVDRQRRKIRLRVSMNRSLIKGSW